MTDMARRFENNPLLSPKDIGVSIAGFHIAGVLNPGAFKYKDRIGLVIRVAEMPPQEQGYIRAPVMDENNNLRILEFSQNDPHVWSDDPRIFSHKNTFYLTGISHLRLAWSEDGIHFKVEKEAALRAQGKYETYGIEDCRVVEIDGTFYLTYTAVSENGAAVALASTRDWRSYQRHGIIFPPHNKDCAVFPGKINGWYYALHRPSGVDVGGHFIWIARSKDLFHWGGHECIAQTRKGKWDSARIGAGIIPIKTEKGWLEIYHGANEESRYCLGALLLAKNNPAHVLARSEIPIMEPIMSYEQEGFFGNVVFTNGHVIHDDVITIYYGSSDEFICGAEFSIEQILTSLA